MTFRYATTDLVSGKVLCDDLPLTVSTFSRNLNGAGQLSGNLDLRAGQSTGTGYGANTPYLAAIEARKAALWVLQDGYPVWCGVIWDWPSMTLSGGQVPISASTFESIFDHRLISADLAYPQVDMFTAFCDLVTYGLTKQSPWIVPTSPTPPAPPAVVAACAVPSIRVPAGQVCGVPWSANYTYSDFQQVSSAWQDMATSGDLEYTFEPGLDTSGNLACFLRLGYLQLGRPPAVSGTALSYPGVVTDYGYQRTGSQGANYVWASAPPNGAALSWLSAYPHGADLTDLAEGYPLMETSVSWPGSWVTAQSQVDGFADGQIPILTGAMTVPTLNIPAEGVSPKLRDITLGDTITFTATSAMHPPKPSGAPGLQATLRVTGWTAYPPDAGQTAYIQLATSTIDAM